ncbi:hypothetical protein KUTeg_015896 [Tegillarca granosa]|uniref:P-type domain-containing protein n=1 Tax=Tegillarca granosa TaxID=220873 RepID=A0ABQ9EN81_TEGGR|nr:hypothetical protein KUTeg_015896 [Tegillarca granosa]
MHLSIAFGIRIQCRWRSRRNGIRIQIQSSSEGEAPFNSPSFKSPVFEVHTIDENVIRFKFDDSSNTRYKVPMKLNLPTNKVTIDTAYEIEITDKQNFAFQIKRKSNGKVIWNTDVGGLTLLDQFLQISTALPSRNIYGFGENLHYSFRHDLNYQTWPMFSRDQAPFWQKKTNLYGVHPFYTCVEDDGNAHGVLLLNSNAQDYSLTPLPMLTYRTIGGILDFYVFMGPTPENVVQKYTEVIGRPFMPPYWALGFQLCRYGYKDIDDLKGAVSRTKQYGIPHDVQYADIDHMEEEKVFTIDNVKFKGLNDTFTELRNGGMRTMIILDPCFITTEKNYEPYDELKKVNGAVMWASGGGRADNRDTDGAMLGYVWPNGKVVFPDFFKNETKELWKKLIVKHRKELIVDGMWIDMNEPANFGTNELKPFNWPKNNTDYWSLKCDTSKYDDPPYRTMAAYVYDTDKKKGRLSDKTLCMVGRQGDDNNMMHYNTHSLFGWSQSEPTLQGMREATGDRSMVLSRSTFPGSGKYAGHWLGDNESIWPGLHTSIIGMLEFGLFGIPYIGADICGFFGNSTAELCKRWMQLGAFYPFSRNHNGIGFTNQDPGAFGKDVAMASKEALETRYWFLPYLYTLFHNAHVHGNTVARPLHHEFPKDNITLGIDTQFMWGKSFLISPILFENQENLTYYLPAGRWYNFYSGNVTNGPIHETIKIKPDSKIPVHVRGGSILPMQEAARNTTYSRKNPMILLVVLDKFDTDGGMAEGELFWDDGISTDTYENGKFLLMKFKASGNILSMDIAAGSPNEGENLILNTVMINGVKREVKTVKLLDTFQNIETFSNENVNMLSIRNLSLPLNQSFRIMWQDTTDEEQSRLDCYPERLGGFDLVTEAKCRQRSCVYNKTDSNAPDCYFKTNQGYYQYGGIDNHSSGFNVSLQWRGEEPFFDLIENLLFSVEFRGENVVRFKFSDANTSRYEVPVHMDLPGMNGNNRKYEVKITSTDPFHFQIIRKSSGTVL